LHCYCVKHIEKNIKTRFGKNINKLLFGAAKATTEAVYHEKMEAIFRVSDDVGDYLVNIQRSAWTTAYSVLPRFGNVTSNIAECFNAWMNEHRNGSHFSIVYNFMVKTMEKFYLRKQRYMNQNSVFPIEKHNAFNQLIRQACRWRCRASSEVEYLVSLGSKSSHVNLDARTCTCGNFTEYKYPCVHAACAIKAAELNFEEFVDELYTLRNIVATYESNVVPIPTDNLENDRTLPPDVLPQAGRPRTLRIRSRNELEPENRVGKCGLCGVTGHNQRTCLRRQRQRVEPL
jgi:SWIM zinc finger